MSDTIDKQDVILLVDDNPDNLQVLYQTLSSLHLKILVAKNGEDAIDIAIKTKPSLILLDIMMPGIDGFEVIKRLKNHTETASLAIILLSALDDLKHKIEGFKLGAVDFIAKPFQGTEVIARVKTHLKITCLEKQLTLKNQQLEVDNSNILQMMKEGLICLNSQGEICYANPAALSMTGWQKEDIQNIDFHDAMQHSDSRNTRLPKQKSAILRALREKESYSSDDEYFFNHQGQAYATEYTITPLAQIPNSTGKIEERGGAFIVFKDISRRKKNEKDLQSALKTVQKLKEKLEAENDYLQLEIKKDQSFCGIIGESGGLKQVLREVEQVAPTDTTVLINGESGTGKEAIARAIHDLSPRKGRPLIKVNCAAIPESLVESELFGHKKGAFTGAVSDRVGHFELADGGTIFLDEIGELSMDIQVKLLRVLQEKEILAVGSSVVTKVDVRFIAATHRDLKKMIDDKLFRLDLFYRLSVFPILIPPLRDRTGDIPLLVTNFLHQLAKKLTKPLKAVTDESLDLLMKYKWPGNIRELQNVMERSAILAQDDTISIDASLLQQDKVISTSRAEDSFEAITLAENERAFIIRTLNNLDWVIGGKKGAAEVLGVPSSTLRSRMKKLGINK